MNNKTKITITAGRVNWSRIQHANGQSIVFDEIGEHRFFVELYEPNGQVELLWDGKSYEAAILEAEDAAREWDGRVDDHVV